MSFPTLPVSWVEEIFAQLALTYGGDFLLKYEGVDAEKLKTRWAQELGGFVNRKDAIVHALKHLPVDRPPNVMQFRVICMGAPEPEGVAEERAKIADSARRRATPEDAARLRAAMKRYQELRAEAAKKPKQWAYDLQERDKAGEPLTEAARAAYKACLSRVEVRSGPNGDFNPIDNSALPPGMRKKERPFDVL